MKYLVNPKTSREYGFCVSGTGSGCKEVTCHEYVVDVQDHIDIDITWPWDKQE